MTVQRISGVGQCEVKDFGHSVQFELMLETGAPQAFVCGYEAMPKLVAGLKATAVAAEKMRNSQPGQLVELVQAYRATGSQTGYGQNRTIVIRFGTTEGLPIQIEMTRQIAEDTIGRLQTALTESSSKTKIDN